MKFRRLITILFGLGLIGGLTAAAAFWQSDRLLNALLRPLAERTAAAQLAAEVRIGHITLKDMAFLVSGVSVNRPGHYRLSLPQTAIGLSPSGLLARRIDRLHLSQPALELQAAHQAASSDGPLQVPDWGVAQLEIAGGRFVYQTTDRRYSLDQIRVETGSGAPFAFRASARLGEAPGLALEVQGSGSWGARQRITLEQVRVGGHQLIAAPLQVTLPQADGPLVSGTLALERFDSGDLAQITAALGLPNATGDWSFELLQPTADLRLDTHGATVELRAAAAEIRTPMARLPLAAVTAALTNAAGSTWQAQARFLLADMAPGRLNAQNDGDGLRGDFSLQVPQAEPFQRRLHDLATPVLAGGLALEADFQLAAGTLRLAADLKGLPAAITPATHGIDLRPLAAQLRLRQNEGVFSGDIGLQLDAREVFRAELGREALRFRLLPTPWQRLAAVFGPGLLPASWRPAGEGGLSGVLSAAGELSTSGEGMRLRLDALAGEKLEFFAADGMTGLTGGRFTIQGEIDAKAGGKPLQLDLKAKIGADEVLRGTFYADLSKLAADADLRATFAPGTLRLQAQRIGLTIDGLGSVRLDGRIAPGATRVAGSFAAPTMAGLFAEVLRTVLGETVSGIETLRLSGALAGDFQLEQQGRAWHARGRLLPDGLDLALPTAAIALENASGVLPFAFTSDFTTTPGESADLQPGNLTFARFAAGPLILEPSPIRLQAAVNRLVIHSPLVFRVAGGRLETEDAAAEMTAGGPDLQARARILEVDLQQLTQALEVLPLIGRLNADLGIIRYANGALSTPGTMDISAFGGDFSIRGMRLEAPLTPYASFFADIDFTALDLFQLTRTLAFGEMNGIADGHIHNLRLFGKTPTRFAAEFATRETGKRNISVKALNNLTVISQGGVSQALSQGIYQFIDFYRYRKIGMACTLERDVFRLEGTARPGSRNYLVDGGILPPRIDVIVSSPKISFTEMVRRLQRVERAGG
jgi:translocation and assembly module TamB